jgi:exodeoxyribonuclease V beta subunit
LLEPLDVRDCPLTGTALIEASAGTGKTWAICALYLRLLLEAGLEVGEILVVTFTNAATAELRDRIRSRLVEAQARLRGRVPGGSDGFVEGLYERLRSSGTSDDATIEQRLESALQRFDEAAIFTIHGFCKHALDDAPFVTGMPLALEQVNDVRDLLLEVTRDFWRRRVSSGTISPMLADALASNGDSPERLAALLGDRVAKPLAQLRWPEDLADGVDPDPTELATSLEEASAIWRSQRDEIVALLQASLSSLPANIWKREAVDAGAEAWDRVASARSPAEVPAKLEKLDLYADDRIRAKQRAKTPLVPAHAFFLAATRFIEARRRYREAGDRARLRLLRDFLTEAPLQLAELKQQRRVVSYDDLLSHVHQRLVGNAYPGFAQLMQKRFPAALIDEFQDTDPLQFEIFRRLYAGPAARVFYVGDPKQAIYRFRNADLHVYLRARTEAGRIYSLNENRRSTRGLIDALNALFGHHPGAFMLQGLQYQRLAFGERARRVLQAPGDGDESLRLWMLPGSGSVAPLVVGEARRAAARATAAEIARLLRGAAAGDIRLGGAPLSGGDIAVLVPSHLEGGLIRTELAALGIGCVQLSKESVFASAEAEELERILAAVLDPTHVGRVRAALATELLGLDASAIAALAQDERAGLAYLERFIGYRARWTERGIGVMIRDLIGREGIATRVLAQPFGERSMTNLLHLAERLQDAASEITDPETLLRWLQSQRLQRGSDDAAQLRLESDRHLVQIVTLHASKGLEYPIVFCPFLFSEFLSREDTRIGVEFHDAEGNLVVDFRPEATDDAAIKARRRLEKIAERVRLAYVALTRAINRCYLVVGPYTSRKTTTQSRSGTLSWLAASPPPSVEDWYGKAAGRDVTALWTAWANAAGPCVGLVPMPQGTASGAELPAPVAELAALPAPASIGEGWRTGSYSSLVRGARADTLAADHDLEVDGALTPAAPADLAPDDILRFPRGAAAGECLHAVFERVDFTQRGEWPAAIDEALRLKPQTTPDPDLRSRMPAMLARMLDDVVSTPLPGGFSLADVPPSRRLVELEFSLPARHFSASALVAVLREHGYAVPRLSFATLQGYLRGFIDLIFAHGGRYYVLDWKSNYLGDSAADYGEGPMADAMAEHGYSLQLLIYTVALHRYLRQRVPDYDYARHVGGALYLFVRGVRPGWRLPGGGSTGVYAHRPALEVIEALSALLEPHGASR